MKIQDGELFDTYEHDLLWKFGPFHCEVTTITFKKEAKQLGFPLAERRKAWCVGVFRLFGLSLFTKWIRTPWPKEALDG